VDLVSGRASYLLPVVILLPGSTTTIIWSLHRWACASWHPPVKHWRIWLEQSFTAHMSLLVATHAFGLGRRHLDFTSLVFCYHSTSVPSGLLLMVVWVVIDITFYACEDLCTLCWLCWIRFCDGRLYSSSCRFHWSGTVDFVCMNVLKQRWSSNYCCHVVCGLGPAYTILKGLLKQLFVITGAKILLFILLTEKCWLTQLLSDIVIIITVNFNNHKCMCMHMSYTCVYVYVYNSAIVIFMLQLLSGLVFFQIAHL